MKSYLQASCQLGKTFLGDEDGAQVVEYALVIAVISLALLIALKSLTGIPIGDLIDKVGTCLTGTCS